MHGFQLTFITIQNRRHKGQTLVDWFLETTSELDICGVTVLAASESISRDHRLHSAHFFELADQPIEIMMAVTAEEADALFARIAAEKIHIFYIKTPIEFGTLNAE